MTSTTVFDVASAQALLVPTAASLCQNKQPEFGQYQFEIIEGISQRAGSEKPNTFVIVQQIACVDAVPAPKHGNRRSFISDPNEERIVQKQIVSLSESYFADIFSGNYERAFAFLSANMRSHRTLEEWSAQMDRMRAETGSITAINIHTITIYDNPPNAPKPGLYVAADYQNSLEKAPFHCGYLIWFRGENSEFEITREEIGLLTYKVLEQIPEESHKDVLAQMRCRAH
jgi:hypothetical protein